MAQPQKKITPSEYLALEREADVRSEYLDGEVFAMAGASPEHVLIVSNLVAALDGLLTERPCAVFSNDQRVKVDSTGLYTYPDVAVACREIRIDEDECLLEPLLLVEVLSKSTQDYDRGTKFAHYRTLDSLADYVLVAQDRRHVEHFTREDGLWVLREIDGEDGQIEIRGLDVVLAMRQIYRKLDLLGG